MRPISIASATLLTGAATLAASQAYAWDLVVKGGMIHSEITPRDAKEPVRIDGAAASAGLKLDLSPKLSFEGGLQPLLNIQTREISRNTVYGTVEWSLLGQTRRYTTSSDVGTLSYFGGSSLYVLARSGIQYYQVYVDKTTGSIKGSTISIMAGGGFRYDVNSTNAIGAQVLATAASFSNSSEGLSVQEYEGALTYIWQLP